LNCVQLLAQFELPHPDNRVEYDFWYTSSSEQALDFLSTFEEYHKRFKQDVFFTPRFVSYACNDCLAKDKNQHCFSDGKYCAFHFGNLNHTGQEILYENLRQKCLHDYLQNKGSDDKWWNYVHGVHANCRDDISEDCSKREFEQLNIPYKNIKECVDNSFYDKNHNKSENRILEKEREQWISKGPQFFPAIIINNQTYRGFLTSENIFQAICEGFKKQPSECIKEEKTHTQIIEGISFIS
jgi:hypothetical protein